MNLDSVSELLPVDPHFEEYVLTILVRMFGDNYEIYSKLEVCVKCQYEVHGDIWIF